MRMWDMILYVTYIFGLTIHQSVGASDIANHNSTQLLEPHFDAYARCQNLTPYNVLSVDDNNADDTNVDDINADPNVDFLAELNEENAKVYREYDDQIVAEVHYLDDYSSFNVPSTKTNISNIFQFLLERYRAELVELPLRRTSQFFLKPSYADLNLWVLDFDAGDVMDVYTDADVLGSACSCGKVTLAEVSGGVVLSASIDISHDVIAASNMKMLLKFDNNNNTKAEFVFADIDDTESDIDDTESDIDDTESEEELARVPHICVEPLLSPFDDDPSNCDVNISETFCNSNDSRIVLDKIVCVPLIPSDIGPDFSDNATVHLTNDDRLIKLWTRVYVGQRVDDRRHGVSSLFDIKMLRVRIEFPPKWYDCSVPHLFRWRFVLKSLSEESSKAEPATLRRLTDRPSPLFMDDSTSNIFVSIVANLAATRDCRMNGCLGRGTCVAESRPHGYLVYSCRCKVIYEGEFCQYRLDESLAKEQLSLYTIYGRLNGWKWLTISNLVALVIPVYCILFITINPRRFAERKSTDNNTLTSLNFPGISNIWSNYQLLILLAIAGLIMTFSGISSTIHHLCGTGRHCIFVDYNRPYKHLVTYYRQPPPDWKPIDVLYASNGESLVDSQSPKVTFKQESDFSHFYPPRYSADVKALAASHYLAVYAPVENIPEDMILFHLNDEDYHGATDNMSGAWSESQRLLMSHSLQAADYFFAYYGMLYLFIMALQFNFLISLLLSAGVAVLSMLLCLFLFVKSSHYYLLHLSIAALLLVSRIIVFVMNWRSTEHHRNSLSTIDVEAAIATQEVMSNENSIQTKNSTQRTFLQRCMAVLSSAWRDMKSPMALLMTFLMLMGCSFFWVFALYHEESYWLYHSVFHIFIYLSSLSILWAIAGNPFF